MRVVEVTSRMQGPLAALLLQHLGAEIVKVEPPGGDFGRKAVPRAGSVGAAYLAYNRGKARVELDYKQPADRDRLFELIAGADVFLQNWPDGRAEALGLDAAAVTRVNPAIVYAHAGGWSHETPPPCAMASDYLVQAHAACGDGLYPDGEMARPSRLTLVDAVGGLVACEGVLSGLYRRARSGRGQHVKTSLFGGAMSLQAHVLAAIERGDESRRRQGRAQWDPFDQPLAASDGYLFAGPLTRGMRGQLARACGLRDLSDLESVAARLRRKPAADWLATLDAAGIPAALVRRDLRTLPSDPVAARWLERADDSCWLPSAPWRFSA
jgi:crotonobetainyl-CoA:carnitine CoA-transferase CaiB-like acyl-CoA transferase